MDIIDIVIAKNKSFTGETESLIQQAQAAMAQANEVASILQEAQEANAAAQEANEAALAAQAQAEAIAEDFDNLKSDFTAAAEALTNEIVEEKVQEALEPIQTDLSELETIVSNNKSTFDATVIDLNTAISQAQTAASNAVNVVVEDANTSAAKIKRAIITKNGNSTSYDVEKNYTTAGQNEDGSMTQKAITNYIQNVKTEIETSVQESLTNLQPNNNNNNNTLIFNVDDAGHFIIINENGQPIASTITEQDIISTLVSSETYQVNGVIGLQIDYTNKSFKRLSEASGKFGGPDFDIYPMYGGRMRCNVLDDGTITAFYGDNNYTEDGSNGQVMIYQPKFYYRRMPINSVASDSGDIIYKENIALSSTEKNSFKLHPIFINENNEELDYVLLPAYEGSLYDNSISAYNIDSTVTIDFNNDKLSSIAGVKPIAGNNTSNLTASTAEKLANNRGTGWHITNMAAESVNQMLLMVEYGELNAQNAIGQGIVKVSTNGNYNCASITGSTSALGNESGTANMTINEINGVQTQYTTDGYKAVSYRGAENLWGNLWRFIGGVNIYGDGNSRGGYPYICKNFNYDTQHITDDYVNIGFKLPSTNTWVSAMGYGNSNYDWVFMPAECQGANSALPVGDSIWTIYNLNGINCTAIGGSCNGNQEAGLFYYACDHAGEYSRQAFGANIMFIPTKNEIYNTNYEKWQNKMRGE